MRAKAVKPLTEGVTPVDVEGVTSEGVTQDSTVTEIPVPDPAYAPDPVAPLDVYSEDHWGRLRNMGYVWDASKGLATRESTDSVAVTLLGDPAYGELGNNKCKTCGMDTGHELIPKCNKCHDDGVPNAPTTPVKTFDDLPLDVQRSIDKHCSESNNGDRAGSHNRAAMIERAIAYQSATVKVEVVIGSSGHKDMMTQ